MRCKKHLDDPGAAVGVCATCLRERLLSVIDAQSQPLPLPPPPPNHVPPPPAPIVFPRSVSPYISRRKSDTGDDDAEFAYDRPRQRFFCTPQVATKKKSKFRLLSNLFRSGSSKSHHSSDPFSDPAYSGSNHSEPNSELLAANSPSCRRKSILRLSSLDETCSTFDGRRGRGMSPDIDSDIGCSPDSWRRTPNRPSQGRVTASPARSQLASGFRFCLSPLMRPSPARHWKGKASGTEPGYSGDIRPAANPLLSTAASLRANRSRKLADFGRFNHNR